MTRGQHESLLLCCEELAPFAPCRFFRRTQVLHRNTLTERIAARLPAARVMRGDRFASVAQGLGVHARRLFS